MDKLSIEEFVDRDVVGCEEEIFGVSGEDLDRDLIEYEDYLNQGGTLGFAEWRATTIATIPCPPATDTIPTIPVMESDPFPY